MSRILVLMLTLTITCHAHSAEPPKDFTNSLGMKFKLIPAGEFMMGSKLTAAELHARFPGGAVSYYEDEHPRHRVRLTRPFYLGVNEVTVGDFREFVSGTDHETTAERQGTAIGYADSVWKEVAGMNWRSPGLPQTDRHPVTCVSWADTVAFCQWLGRKEGRTYRLPMEAEWEYACRAGTQTVFSWGDDADDGEGYVNGADLTGAPDGRSWHGGFDFRDGHASTASVGSFKPNAWGLCDMHGNVFEWCQDWYDFNYYETSPTDDPTGATSGSAHVFRGGSWGPDPGICRSAGRYATAPDGRRSVLGFRVALDPAE